MSLELSKNVATTFLAQAKREKDHARASMQRSISEARAYYNNYTTALKRAAKSNQEMLEWDQVVSDLKDYEPDREIVGNLEEILANLRNSVSRGTDNPDE